MTENDTVAAGDVPSRNPLYLPRWEEPQRAHVMLSTPRGVVKLNETAAAILLIKVAVAPEDTASVPESVELAAVLGYDGVVAAFEHWPSVAAVCARIAASRAWLGEGALVTVCGAGTADAVLRYLRAGADLIEVYSAVAESGAAIANTLRPPASAGGACR